MTNSIYPVINFVTPLGLVVITSKEDGHSSRLPPDGIAGVFLPSGNLYSQVDGLIDRSLDELLPEFCSAPFLRNRGGVLLEEPRS